MSWEEVLPYLIAFSFLAVAVWLLWQWRRTLEMVRIRDQALESMATELRVMAGERDRSWEVLEQSRTDLRESQRALDRSERMMRQVLDTIPVRLFWKNRDFDFVGGNRLFLEDVGLQEREGLDELSDRDMPWGDEWEYYLEEDKKVIETLRPLLYKEKRFPTGSGNFIWLKYSKIPMRNENGKIVGMLGIYENITTSKRTESAYRESERKLAEANHMMQLVLNHIPARVFWKDRNLRYLGANRLFLQDTGFTNVEELIGKSDFQITWKQQAEKFRSDDRRVIQTMESRLNFEEEHQTISSKRWVRTSKVPLRDADNEAIGVLGIYEDITERKRDHEELARLRQLLGAIVDAMPSVLIGVDGSGHVTQWNREAARFTGVTSEQAMALSLKKSFPLLACYWEEFAVSGIGEKVWQRSLQQKNDGGEVRDLELTVYPLVGEGVEGAVLRLDDVSERTRMEEIMIQTEKMMSVGGLAAGMAHEINNPLAGIVQNIQVMRNRLGGSLPRNEKTAEAVGTNLKAIQAYMETRGVNAMMEAILDSGRRAAQIVSNMLSFSRKGDSQYSECDLRELLDQTLELASNDYDLKRKYDFRNIHLERDYQVDMPKVPCEMSKIQQVFLNLLKNGAQAMFEQSVGKRDPVFSLRIYTSGEMAWIEIQDNGPGMDFQTRKRIFEPFFTTKAVGVGTGLGLSVSYFIITENHGGFLGVNASPENGACFRIGLPLERKQTRSDWQKEETKHERV